MLLSEHDYDANATQLNSGNVGAVVATLSDPTGTGSGNVGSVDISGSGTVWGEIRPTPNGFPLPAGTTAGVDTLFATFDIFVPSTTTFSSTGGGVDRVNLIIRQSSGPDNANRISASSNNNWNTIAQDTWQTISVNVPISALDGVGSPITELTPIISFYDPNTNASAGTAAYIDNWSFSVTNAIPEPTSAFLAAFASLGLLRRRR